MPKALLSVYDKTGLVDFAAGLHNMGWELLASGGTARVLREADLPVVEVSDYTGSPEILGGRVKTLHPAIHGGILSRSTDEDKAQLDEQGWEEIDLVAVNLYPFEETIARADVTLAEAIEQIDIGGVALIRAAAKNFARVAMVCDPADYAGVLQGLEKGDLSEDERRELAVKGFASTAHYDRAILAYLSREESLQTELFPVQELRYGENSHQQATLYAYEAGAGPLGGKVLQGKALSYNNLLDLDAAWRTAVSFDEAAIAIVKHLSPCGVAANENLVLAYQQALASDPVSAFGSVIAINREVDGDTAIAMKKLFVECVIAPGFSQAALEIYAKKKNCRLVEMPDLKVEPDVEMRSIVRGVLRQDVDMGDPQETEWKVVSKRQPTEAEWAALGFSWKVVQHAKSNAIVFANQAATVGVGSGQPNRVDCVHIAAQRAGEHASGAVMASDAFFPFPDAVEAAKQYGITAIIQPGGSIRDELSVAAADEAGMAMVMTGVRHFRH
jgi:phosphoribosylaminoimidazolecarboxamide formyltransferase / IMP cyclohydrolase